MLEGGASIAGFATLALLRSALSMLVFYENRAGKNLSASRRRALDQAKDELRKLYHRPLRASSSPRRAR